MRDIETVDSELGLLVAIRRMAHEAKGPPPNMARIDALLDERCELSRVYETRTIPALPHLITSPD